MKAMILRKKQNLWRREQERALRFIWKPSYHLQGGEIRNPQQNQSLIRIQMELIKNGLVVHRRHLKASHLHREVSFSRPNKTLKRTILHKRPLKSKTLFNRLWKLVCRLKNLTLHSTIRWFQLTKDSYLKMRKIKFGS